MRSRFVSVDAPRAVVAALRAHSTSPAVAESGCTALLRFASGTLGSSALDAEAAGTAIAILGAHVDNVIVAERVCEAMNIFAYAVEFDQDLKAVSSLSIVAALRAHPGNATVARFGCSTLAGFARHEQGVRAVTAAGAVSVCCAVLRALLTPDANVACAFETVRLLRNISTYSRGELLRDSAANVAAVLVSVLRKFQGNGNVVRQCSATFQNMAMCKENMDAFLDAGAFCAIVETLRAWTSDADIVYHCCCALDNALAQSDSTSVLRVIVHAVDAGAPCVAVAALRKHMHNAQIAVRVCWILMRLAQQAVGQKAVVAADSVPALVDLCCDHRDQPGTLVSLATRTLKALATVVL
jgi:hypothetical protein